LSEEGVKIEGKAAEYFAQGKYAKALAKIIELIYPPGMKRALTKFMIRLFGRWFIGKVEYPNDFVVEVQADRAMNFQDRLTEIIAPTLILSGESDIGYTAEDVRATAEGIPNAKLILYEGYGHNLAMANSMQVQKDILEFLRNKY
jgi:pimeloyl-ACP methyl ester carboxylesterase